MKITAFASTAVLAPVLATILFAAPVMAQDTHTISPKFPDHFEIRATQTSDQSQETALNGTPAKTEKTTTNLSFTGKTDRAGDGFHAVYTIDTLDMKSTDGTGQPSPSAPLVDELAKVIRGIGPAQLTLDRNLDPVSIDNIEDIKAHIKTSLEGSSAMQGAAGTMLYNMMIGNLTPETAAGLLRQNGQRGSYLNKPLTVGQAVAFGGEPISLMGGTFRMGGTVTLTKWEEGKAAHLTSVMAPTQDDLRTFIGGVIKNMMGSAMAMDTTKKDPEAAKAVNEMFDRMVAAMDMKMSMTCDTDLSLVNYVDTHTVCSTSTVMTMDMGKMAPRGPSEDKPAVMTVTQMARQTADTVMVK
ncbi:hypothetical protein AEAC466_14575 [Asticcacaulis sp. AC466]|uniref:hypothetical protein n=1 Tax=Asticcacaulis sp. AC466 TaxID=1282362 RepID=UPI0003C40BBC|nr:hypothetical protein [Asticcacaulis sp. AC466]ESQ83085.1 hypothetical protein AEAC466_14575 [Asticcacaulis sp. AC466]